MKLRKNKKGDVPVMVLVLGVLTICILTIMSFSINSGKSKDSLSEVAIVEKAAFDIDKYNFYLMEDIGLFKEREYGKIANYFEIGFDKELGRYLLIKDPSKKEISVRYYIK